MSLRSLSLPLDEVDIKQIKGSSNPLRVNLGEIEGLCSSINENGLLQPLIIRNHQGKFEVVAGNRRLEACRRLKWRKVPCQIVELSDKEAFEFSLAENVARQSLDPLEEGRAFKKYVTENGWGGVSELAKRIGKSPSYVSKRVSLLEMSPEVLEKIFRHRKSPSIAEEILSLEVEDQLQIARTLEVSPMPTQEVRKMVKTIKLMKSADEKSDLALGDTWKAQINNRHFVLKCIDQTISALRLALTRMDSVLDKLESEWLEREMLLQYRVSLHSQLDSLIRLKRKIALAGF
jgi:ParB family chromosome partitioning protein